MTTADQLAIVERRLGGEAKAVALAEGGMVQGWMKARRMLVIARQQQQATAASKDHSLLVFVSSSFPVSSPSDLTLESAVPIDADFRCEIDSGEAVLVKISRGAKTKLMFEMLPGYHTQNFVAEVYRQTEEASAAGANRAGSPSLAWAAKYLSKSDDKSLESSLSGQLESKASLSGQRTPSPNPSAVSQATTATTLVDADDDPSPEASLNRQDIAMGVTPIAARESIVKYQMALKEDQYTNLQTFTVFVGTWNVNGQSPAATPDGKVRPLTEWLARTEEPPDLYAIGFQELDLSKEAFVFNESAREDEWREVVSRSLHPGARYEQVKLVRLVGMMLIVYVRKEHLPHIRNVASDTVGTGVMGKLGNKGGVSVRLDFHATSVCFVDSHLAAHASELERRNQDYHDICARTSFQAFSPPKSVKDHDMVYWLGDLNYRIDDMEAAQVKQMLKHNALKELQKSDQLFKQRAAKKIFVGYREGDINFIPTYKFDPGTNEWDSSEKGRAPAWTDRILYRGDHISQTRYQSHMDLFISDHKPVSSSFRADVKVVDHAKYRKIYEEVMKKLDRLENEFLPQVTVDNTEVCFDGEVRFMEPRSRTLAVANTGQVPVQFEFIRKLNDRWICKPWLTVEPTSGFVMPGEKADVTLEVHVDKSTAGALTCGQDQMYDILVLHLVGGKDIFVTVSGEYKRSCFGASVEALCRMTVPIAELPVATLLEYEGKKKATAATEDSADGKKDKDEHEPYPVPKELWFLCDLITSLGLQQDNLFLQAGMRAEVLKIRDWLDTGLPAGNPDVSVHSAAEALLIFLESLREPIVPFPAYARCLEAAPNYLQCLQIVATLPPRNKNVFNYLTAFLREVVRQSSSPRQNPSSAASSSSSPPQGADPKILATLFASIFLRDPPGSSHGSGIRARAQQQLLDQKKARFVYHFIVNDPDVVAATT